MVEEEAVLVVGNAQLLGKVRGALAGVDAYCEDYQIAGHFHALSEQGVCAADNELACAVGVDLGNTAADVLCAVFLHCPAGELVVELSGSADVHVEDVGLGIRDVVLGEDCLFGRVHAAKAGAQGATNGLVARAHALNEDNALGFPAVRGALDVAASGARGV